MPADTIYPQTNRGAASQMYIDGLQKVLYDIGNAVRKLTTLKRAFHDYLAVKTLY